MAQRWRSRARRDPDLDDGESPPQRRAPISDEEEEAGNEDLSLEIVARARRREAAGGRSGFHDLLSLSSSEEVDEDAVVELLEADPRRKQKKKRRKAKKKQRKEAPEAEAAAAEKEEPQVGGTQERQTGTAESVLTEDGVDVPVSDNIVLRKLLRIPRYFDPGETMLETCFNCCEEGHVAANCPMEKRKKPCFVCGLFGHNAKQCTQGQDCFICKKEGHKAKDCPEKHKRNTQQSITLCLRCGETGHDMFGCANNYPPDDVKEIKCYVCKQNGHLCCADLSDNCPKEVSCYNCAQSGHIGLGCAKRRENSAATNPTKCFKCGEEGHIAKGCTKNAKSDRFKGEWLAHSRNKDKGKNDFGTRSAPHDARKTSKRKVPLFEERRDASRGKSRARGGWIVDDPDDLTFMKYKSNGWASPSTPKKPYISHQYSSGGDYSTPQSSRGQKHGFASRSSNYSSNTRKHGFSSSRFADNTNARSGRS